jgi:hypothetical protein
MNLAAGMLSGVMSMIESAKAEKKVWVAPALDELAIEKTLGGNVPFFQESQVSQITGQKGSYPG